MNKKTEDLEVVDKRRRLSGQVISHKANNTLVVLVKRKVAHPLYKKMVARDRKYQVDFRSDVEVKEKDIVEIVECGRVSKTKSWAFSRLLSSAV